MNALITSPTASITMSSREIAHLTGKRHYNVMRDIRSMIEGLELTHLNFEGSYILITGYSVTLRANIIDRWQVREARSA